ncbi:hypothetical protein MRX96_032910 [Rhipicephalus microplus]
MTSRPADQCGGKLAVALCWRETNPLLSGRPTPNGTAVLFAGRARSSPCFPSASSRAAVREQVYIACAKVCVHAALLFTGRKHRNQCSHAVRKTARPFSLDAARVDVLYDEEYENALKVLMLGKVPGCRYMFVY